MLIDSGADPHTTVQKLEFYRKLDEHKKHLIVMAEQRVTNQTAQNALMQDAAEAAVTSLINTVPNVAVTAD